MLMRSISSIAFYLQLFHHVNVPRSIVAFSVPRPLLLNPNPISTFSPSALKMTMGDASELTSALARMDNEFQLARRSSRRPTGGRPGWTKLILEDENENENDDTENKAEAGDFDTPMPKQEEFVYLLEPPTTPSLVLSFLGGAGLGQFPHVAYNELLTRISLRLNAAIFTVPYSVSLDHFALSRQTGELLRRALVQCGEKNSGGGYSEDLPHFYMGHSLGGKLLAIALSASGVRDVAGVGYVAFNNFGFGDTLSMVKSFADNFNNSDGDTTGTSTSNANSFNNNNNMNMGGPSPMLDQILNMAGQAVDMMGVDFDPNPAVMHRILEQRYDDALQEKTRFFVFDDDELDSSDGFIQACSQPSSSSSPSSLLTTSNLRGNHLTPVYIQVGMDDLVGDVPEEYRELASDAANGFRSASFGDEDLMNAAVDEICNWILGKEPSRTTSGSSSSRSGSFVDALPGKQE